MRDKRLSSDGPDSRAKVNLAVVGVGNTIRLDDAAGIEVARKAASILGCGFYEETAVDVGLLDLLDEHELVVLIDSIQTGCDSPGTLKEFSPGQLTRPVAEWGPHGRNLATVLQLARATGIDLDRKLVIYAVEVERTNAFGEELTPKVAAAIGPVAETIAALTRSRFDVCNGGTTHG